MTKRDTIIYWTGFGVIMALQYGGGMAHAGLQKANSSRFYLIRSQGGACANP